MDKFANSTGNNLSAALECDNKTNPPEGLHNLHNRAGFDLFPL